MLVFEQFFTFLKCAVPLRRHFKMHFLLKVPFHLIYIFPTIAPKFWVETLSDKFCRSCHNFVLFAKLCWPQKALKKAATKCW